MRAPPLGRLLDEGKTRRVYEHAGNPACVVKVAKGPEWAGANAAEWEVHRLIHGSKHSRWVARCHRISDDGMWLVMERTEPLRVGDSVPGDVPAWFGGDVKLSNWGRLNGRVVLHDYQHANPPGGCTATGDLRRRHRK